MMTTLWLICREPNKKVQIHVILIRKLIAKMVVMPFFGDFALVGGFCDEHKLWLDHQVFAT